MITPRKVAAIAKISIIAAYHEPRYENDGRCQRKTKARMSAKSRKEQIQSLLANDPQDQFLRYGLAMELQKEEAYAESEKIFRELMSDATPYVPAFFMLAQQLVRDDRGDDAKPVLEQGIRQAEQQSNQHAAAEMTGFLASLE